MKKSLLCFFVFFGMCTTSFAAYNTTDIYLLAQNKSTTELKKIENIDVVDSTGNTALCSAIKYGDVDAYNKLKEAGANTEHKCTKKIPTEQYQSFIQKVAAASKPWSFLGLGKWAWSGIGAAVVAGGAVAGMGGGGSSGGGGNDTSGISCEANAYHNGIQCVCNPGYENYISGVGCTPIDCGPDAYHDGTQCVCSSSYENYVPGVGCTLIDCGENASYDGTQCVCEPGYENYISGVGCTRIECGENAYHNGIQCVCEWGSENYVPGVG